MINLEVTLNTPEVIAALKLVPQWANGELNKAFKTALESFAKDYAPRTFNRGGPFYVQVKRRITRSPRGHPNLPAKMRRAGFKTRITNFEKIEGKDMFIRTGNPLLIGREFGNVIRPKTPGGLLAIRGKFSKRDKSSWTKQAAIEKKLRPLGFRTFRPIARRVRSVEIEAKLGLRASWARYHPRAMQIIQETVTTSIAKRWDKLQARRAQRGAA